MRPIYRRDLWLLLSLSLVVRLAVAAFILRPGYMDAAYYAAGASHLAQGGGLSEPFLWNYLDDPAGIPHPGFLYWMPLPSLLAAPLAALFPGSFLALQLPFALLSALLPLVSYSVAWQVAGKRRHAWVAGLLTLFSGLFFPYWTLPETFAPFALFGSLALWLAGRGMQGARCKMQEAEGEKRVGGLLVSLLVGLLVGLAHLTRADGILLLPVVILPLLARPKSRTAHPAPRFIIGHWSLVIVHCSFVILGYLVVMGPWFLRNLSVVGAPLSPAGTRTLWLRTYDDLFCYGCDLSLRSYLAWGWTNILKSKLWALGVNLERFLAEDCLVFLLPFVLIGLYRLRRRSPFTLVLIYSFLIYFFHSFAFTFPGPRGGFFHASAPALPFLFAAAMEGLDAAVGWVARRRRGWDVQTARVFFSVGFVLLAIALSGYLCARYIPAWNWTDAVYEEVGAWLDAYDVPDSTIVLVGNPPSFWYHVGRPSVVVPNGGEETLLAVARRYGVDYLVLDQNRPAPLAGFYARRGGAGWALMVELDEGRVQVYRRTEVK